MNHDDDAILDEARQALQQQQPQAALSLVRTILQRDPGDVRARLIEARAQLALHRPQATLAALDAVDLHHEQAQGRPDVAMLRLQALAAAGEYALALRLADDLIRRFPDDPRPHRAAADMALQLNQPDRAAQALRTVVRLCPTDSAARRTLASLVEMADPDEAIALLMHADDSPDQTHVARLMVRAGRWRDGQELYRQLLRMHASDPALRDDAGRLADAMGDDALATRLLENPEARARAHMHAGRLAAAGRAWWRAIRHGHGGVRAWTGLLLCAIETGHDRAASQARRHLDLHASRQERQQSIAELWPHAACGLAVNRATRRLHDAEAPSPSPLQTLLRQATATLQRQVKRYPRRADAHYHLASCRAALGQHREADAAVSEALRLNPSYAAASGLAMRLGRRIAA